MKMLTVIAEFSGKNWSAFSPVLSGVYVTAESLAELAPLFLDATRFHIEGLEEAGDPIPAIDLSRLVIYPVVPMSQLGKWRKSLGITQKEIAVRLDLPQSRVSDLERSPGTVSFDRISKYLKELG